MENTLIYVALVTGFLALLVRWALSGSGNRPPGPTGLPIVGYLPFMSKDPHLDFQRLAEKYGNIFSLRLGSRNVVVLSDYQLAKEAFAKDSFMGRPNELFEASQVTIETNAFFGLPWREQRRFTLHMLRDLGLGKSKMEGQLQEEISELLDHFEQHEGKPFCVRDLLAPSMSNNIGTLIFGKRFKYDDPVRKMLNDAVNANVTSLQQVGWLIFFPTVKKFLQLMGPGKRVYKASKELNYYTRKEIEEHEKTLDPNNIRDLIDGYLLEIQKRKNDPCFCKDVLEDLVVGFFGAGSETVRVSLDWLLLIVASCPEAQKRIQAEVDDVIGHNRLPTVLDQKAMPFTDALIMEFNRWRTIVPINILRLTLTDTELNGYFIPKNSLVIANLWAIHHNKKYWGEDADEFRPERFLSEDGKSVQKREHYIPFSIGKRACPGEPLAKVEVFLYLTSILQRFDVKLPDGCKPDFDGTVTAALQPKLQDIILVKRPEH